MASQRLGQRTRIRNPISGCSRIHIGCVSGTPNSLGRQVLGEATKALRHTISDLLENGGRKIVLNLTDVNYIDSSGIGELVRTYTTVTKEGKQLILLNLTKKTSELLVITKLLTVFQVFESEEAAVASFS